MAKDLEFTAKVASDISNAGGKGEVLSKLIDAWNSKNAIAGKRVGTFGFMAATLAACGGGSSNTDSQNEASTFSLDLSGTTASLSGLFAALTGSGVQEVSFSSGTQADGLVDTQAVPGTEELLDGATDVVLQNDVTLVGAIEKFDVENGGLSVSGNGNVWLLIGEEGTAGEYSAKLNIVLSGGDLTFDMPGDADRLVLLDGTVINLNGGTLEVSDGVVSANLSNVQFLNIGDVVINSELVITYDQFADKLASGDISISGTGKLTVVVNDDSQSQEFFDVLIADPSILGATAPTIVVQNVAGTVTSEVDPLSLIDSKVSYLAKVLQAEIDALKAGQGEDFDAATFQTLASISAKLDALNSLVGATSVSDQISAALGEEPVFDADTGLFTIDSNQDTVAMAVAAAINASIISLRATIEGDSLVENLETLSELGAAIELLNGSEETAGSVLASISAALGEEPVFDADTGLFTIDSNQDTVAMAVAAAINASITSLRETIEGDSLVENLETLSELGAAIELLNADDATSGSVAFDIKTAFDTLTTEYGTAITTAINTLTTSLQGEGFDADTDLATFKAISDAIELLNADDATSGSVAFDIKTAFDTLTTAYGTAITTAINTLTTSLQGEGFDADTDLATFKAISDAIELLNADDATSGSVAFDIKTAFDTLTTAYGTAITTAINTLTTSLQGEGFDADTDLATFKAISDAIELLNADASSTADSVASDLLAQYNTLTTEYGTAITTAINTLTTSLQGEGFDADTDLATFKAISDAIELLNADDATSGSVAFDIKTAFDTLTTAYGTAITTAIDDLELQLAGDTEGLDSGVTLQTLVDLSNAVAALQDASSGAGGTAETLTSLQSQINDLVAGIDVVAPTVTSITLSSVGADSAGVLNAGDVVTATVTFSEAVLVTGAPTLDLDIGGEVDAVYVGGAGTDKLTFEYTILAIQTDTDGISVPDDALQTGVGNTIKDSWGNDAVTTFAAIGDNSAFIVDNGPLALTYTAGALFGADLDSDKILIGFVEEFGDVFLSDLSASNTYVVPAGRRFVSVDDDITSYISSSLAPYIEGPATVTIDFSDKLVWNPDTNDFYLLTETTLRDLYIEEGGFGTQGLTIDEYIELYTTPASTIGLYDGFLAGETLGSDVVAQLDGHDPATVDLTVTTPLTIAQAVALEEAGFDLAKVTFSIRDYDTTVQGALLLTSTADVLRSADLVTAIGDELDNEAMRFTSFDQRVDLRIEALEGDDEIDAGRGDDQIVGGLGSDVIELTYKDTSNDTVIYQTIYDGETLPVTTLTFSSDAGLYLEGSLLSATINGQQVVYEVTSPTETPEQAVANFANLASLTLSEIDPAKIVVGVMLNVESGIFDNDQFTDDDIKLVTLADFENGQYTVPQTGEVFVPYSSFVGDNLFGAAALNSEFNGSGPELLLQVAYYGVEGGQTFSITNEQLFIDPFFSQEMGTDQYMLVSEEYLSIIIDNPTTYADFIAVNQVKPSSQVLSGVTSVGETVTFYGADTTTVLEVTPGTDSLEAISNPGQKSRWKVEFSDHAGDYPNNASLGGTFEFDRQVSVTIDSVTVTADIVYTAPDQADPAATIAALKTAIEVEMGAGRGLETVLGSVVVESNGVADVVLVLEGKVSPANDTVQVPTFTVDSAAIDVAGEQQQTTLSYSDDNADYYAGGTLSATIAGQTITADMVAGNASASVGALVAKIEAENLVELEIVEQLRDTTFNYIGYNQPEGPSWVDQIWLGNGEENRYRDIDALQQDGTIYTVNAYSWSGQTVSITQDDFTEASVTLIEESNFNDGFIKFASWDDFAAVWQAAFRRVMTDENDSLTVNVVQADDITRIIISDTDLTNSPQSGDFSFVTSGTALPGFTLTAATETHDPILADAEQSYEGEYQQATVLLDDGGVSGGYSARVDGTDVYAGEDLSPVYFDNGRIYLSITETDPELIGGLGDTTLDTVTVSADMEPNGMSSTALVEAINQRITEGNPDSLDTTVIVTIEGSFTGLEVLNYGDGQINDYWPVQLDGQWTNGASISHEVYMSSSSYSFSSSDGSGNFSSSINYYIFLSGSNNYASFSDPLNLNNLLTFLTNYAEIDTADINDDGDIVITSVSGVKELSVKLDFQGSEDFAIALTDEDQLEGGGVIEKVGISGSAPDLGNVLEKAELGDDGTITLTAKDAGREMFEISDVRLDYAGVKQIATVTLEDKAAYDQYSFDDGNGSAVSMRADAEANVYYDGGKVYANIDVLDSEGAVDRTVTVSADMALERPDQIVLTLSAVDATALTDDMEFDYVTDAARVVLNPESIEQEEINIVEFETLGSFIANLDAVPFVTRAELSNGAVEITIDTTQLADSNYVKFVNFFADVSFGGKILQVDNTETVLNASVEPTSSSILTTVNAAVETTSALADAIQGEIAGDLAGVLGSVTADGTTITLKAATAGELTFKVSDITLDYAGVKQIAEVDFSQLDDGDSSPILYYDGGNLAVTIKATDADGNQLGQDIVITADMADGATDLDTDPDAEGTLAALVAEIESEIDGAVKGETARVQLPEVFDGSEVLASSPGDLRFTLDFFVDTDGDLGTSSDRSTFTVSLRHSSSEYFVLGADIGGNPLPLTTGFGSSVPGVASYTAESLVNWLNSQQYISDSNLIISYESGQITVESKQIGVTQTVGIIVATDENAAVDDVNESDAGESFIDTGVDESSGAGRLTGIVSSVSVDQEGVITLTSADYVKQQFVMTAATASDEAKAEITEVSYSSADADYFVTGIDPSASAGRVSLTVDGLTYVVSMEDTMEDTMAKLANAVINGQDDTGEGSIEQHPDGTSVAALTTATFTRDGSTFTFTANAVNDLLEITGAASVDATQQVTEISFGPDFDDNDVDDVDFIAGIGREISITIAGQMFTIDGASRAELMEDLRAQLRDAVEADTTEVGIAAKLQTSGIVLDEGNKLTLTARYGEADPLSVSDLTRAGVDPADPLNVEQQVKLGFTKQYLTSVVGTTKTLSIELGQASVQYTLTGSETGGEIVAAIATALEADPLISTAVVSETDSWFIDVTASYPGPDVMGTVASGAANTVRLFEENGSKIEITTGFFVEETAEGNIVLDPDTPQTVGSATEVTAGVDLVSEDATKVTTDTTQAAKAETDEAVDYTNPGFGGEDDSGFFGDASQDGNGDFEAGDFPVPSSGNYTFAPVTFEFTNVLTPGDSNYGGASLTNNLNTDGVITHAFDFSVFDESTYAITDPSDVSQMMRAFERSLSLDLITDLSANTVAANGALPMGGQASKQFLILLTDSGSGDSYLWSTETDASGVFPGATPTLLKTWGGFTPSELDFKEGILQTFENPADSYTANSGSALFNDLGTGEGDATFYGDDPLTGALDEGGLFNGEGVLQTHTNPDNGYTAIDGSPELDSEDIDLGDSSLFGSEQGYYDDIGLWTPYLNGATPVVGEDLFVTDSNGEDLTGIIDIDGTVNVGEDATTSDLAGEDIVGDRDGFAPFTWDAAATDLITLGNDEADVILNFQVNHDLIALEGALAESTIEGEDSIDSVYGRDLGFGYLPTTPFESVETLDRGFEIDLGTSSADESFSIKFTEVNTWNEISNFDLLTAGGQNIDSGFQYNVMIAQNSLSLNEEANSTYYPDSVFLMLPTEFTTFGSVQEFVQYMNDNSVYRFSPSQKQDGDTNTFLDWGFEFNDGVLQLQTEEIVGTTATVDSGSTKLYQLAEQSSLAPDLDLSLDEFGLVQHDESTLDSEGVTDSDLVADLLNSLFDFSGSANADLNTTIFAVTASDNDSVTAIWAHQQSSTDDGTVEALELHQLATVNTINGEFSLENFADVQDILQVPVV